MAMLLGGKKASLFSPSLAWCLHVCNCACVLVRVLLFPSLYLLLSLILTCFFLHALAIIVGPLLLSFFFRLSSLAALSHVCG